MTESPAETVRRGAEKMRKVAQAAMTHGTGRNWWTAPELGSWIPDQDDAAYMSAMDPSVALLIADQWDEVADDMEDCQAREILRIPAWAKMRAAAVKFLGEEH